MSEPLPYAPVTLDAIGEATDPMDLRPVSDSVVLTCHVTGTCTYVLEVSNDERSTRAWDVVATYTASVVKRLRGSMPRYIRARMTAGTGSVAVGTGLAKNSNGTLCEVQFESVNS